jgi:hypothetical protein
MKGPVAMNLFTRLSVAALLSGFFLFSDVPTTAAEAPPAADTSAAVAKDGAKGKAKAGKKKGKKGKKGKKKGGKKKGKKPTKAASA